MPCAGTLQARLADVLPVGAHGITTLGASRVEDRVEVVAAIGDAVSRGGRRRTCSSPIVAGHDAGRGARSLAETRAREPPSPVECAATPAGHGGRRPGARTFLTGWHRWARSVTGMDPRGAPTPPRSFGPCG